MSLSWPASSRCLWPRWSAAALGLWLGGVVLALAGEPVRIVASFLPAYCLAAQVAGDAAEVALLGAAGESPHAFQLKPSELRRLGQARAVCVNGLGLEPWLPKVLAQMERPPAVIELASGLETELIQTDPEAKHPNPHFWLDPLLAARAATNLAERLAALEPARAAKFRANAGVCAARLVALHRELAGVLGSMEGAGYVALHDAFPYLARRYGWRQVGVILATPESEASPRHMSELLAAMRREGARVVFSEKGESPRLAERLAKDAGAAVIELETIETGAIRPDSYEQAMRRNMEAIRRGADSLRREPMKP